MTMLKPIVYTSYCVGRGSVNSPLSCSCVLDGKLLESVLPLNSVLAYPDWLICGYTNLKESRHLVQNTAILHDCVNGMGVKRFKAEYGIWIDWNRFQCSNLIPIPETFDSDSDSRLPPKV